MTPSEVEKEFEEFKGKFMAEHQNPKNREFFHDAESLICYAYLEAYSRQQKKIEKLKAGLSDLINTIEFLNPFGSGHPNIKLRIQLDTLKKLLDET